MPKTPNWVAQVGKFRCNMFTEKLPEHWMFLEDPAHDLR